MPYIFGHVKCAEKQNLTKASKMPRKIVAKRARKSALRCALRPSVLHAQKSDCCHVYVEMSEKVARKTINRAVLYNKDMYCSLFIYCVPCKIKAERFCSVGKMGDNRAIIFNCPPHGWAPKAVSVRYKNLSILTFFNDGRRLLEHKWR